MPTDDKSILRKMDRFFRSALDHPSWMSFRENAVTCYRYKEGDQWTDAEKKVLNQRHQPATVNNQIKVIIDRMVGQFVRNRVRIGFRGRNQPDDPMAQLYSDVFLFIRQNNNVEFEERDLAEDGFTCGFGVIESRVTFDDNQNPEIVVRRKDPFELFPDPNSRAYDWNEDARFICASKWVDVEILKEMYPGKARRINALITQPDAVLGTLGAVDDLKNETYVDEENRRARLVECWYKVYERQRLLISNKIDENDGVLDLDTASKSDIQAFRDQDPDATEINRLDYHLNQGIFTGGILFEHGMRKQKRYPWDCYYERRKESGEPYSGVGTVLSLQDVINKRESKAVHLLTANQTIHEQNAIQDINRFQEEMAKPDGVPEVTNGAISNNRIILLNNLELAATQFNLHNQAKVDLRRNIGINEEALGERSEVRSGVGIARKQLSTDLIISPALDNLRRTRKNNAMTVLELVQLFYNSEKVFTITDDFQQARLIELNTSEENRVKQGIYDVVVEELPDFTTIRQEQFQTLAQILPQVLSLGPRPAQLLIQMSDLRDKEEILRMLQGMSGPPPIQPRVSMTAQLNELTPIERATMYALMGQQQTALAVLQENPDTSTETRERSQLIRELIKQEGEDDKLTVERQKALMDLLSQEVAQNGGQGNSGSVQ